MVYSNVNLRQGPGTNFNILVTIPAGAQSASSAVAANGVR